MSLIGAITNLNCVSGQTIARRAERPPACEPSAVWVVGRLDIATSKKLASEVFGVSIPLISEALAKIDPAQMITLSAEQKAAIARAFGEQQLWEVLELATSQ